MPKEFLTYQQQMEKLRSSGLTIEDEGACCRVLADIGYFPVVNGYQSFFRDPSTRVYREGATFGDILALYEFDVELREIMLDALLKVEVKIRSAVAYEFCAAYGESQSKYLDARCYAASKGSKRVLPKLLNMLDYIANKDTSHEYLAYYRRAYKNVPLWVAGFGRIIGDGIACQAPCADALRLLRAMLDARLEPVWRILKRNHADSS